MIDQVIVVVPARDEQDSLPECLRHLHAAGRELVASYPAIEVRLIVALDGCTDDTAAGLVNAPGLEIVTVQARTAGGARAAGVEHALAPLSGPLHRVWLANTDADSSVPSDWLLEMVRDAERGARLVLGTVEPDADLDPELRQRWSDRHQLVEGHPYVHGANFGIRADAYVDLGGWAALSTGEDSDLAGRANRAGNLKIVRTSRIPVTTSSRLVARAPGGFADYLRSLGQELLTDQAS